MKILVFGKNGQVARALHDLEPAFKADFVFAGRESADLSASGSAAAAINTHKPQYVINAAAYTAVDSAEDDEAAAAQLNTHAVEEMAKTCATIGARFIHLSTDYVFDGTANALYTEDDTPNPLSAYGRTKLDGERAALGANPATIILRTSWVFSPYGNNFVKTMRRLGVDRDTLNVVSDQIGGPTSAHDIAVAVLKICAAIDGGNENAGIFHYQSGPSTSWADFAREIFAHSNLNVAISDIPTTDYPTPAARPLKTLLDCSRITKAFGIRQSDWRISLKACIEQLEAETASTQEGQTP